jgi:thiamine transporter
MKRLPILMILFILLLAALPCLAETAATSAPDAAAPAVEATAAPEAAAESAEAPEEAPGNWFQTSTFTEKLAAVQWYTWLVVISLIVLAAALIKAGKAQWNARMLAYAAMTVAISFVLSTLRVYRMLQGGSITLLSMLPIIAFSLAFGPARGALVGCAYGFLQLLYDPYVIHPLQMLVDYPLAFAALALGGFAEKSLLHRYWKLPLAVLIGSLGRYLMAVLSGVVFFAEYAGDQNVLIYSSVYNITYLGPDALLCLAAALLPGVSRIVAVLRAGRNQA